jgi:hypothetical protein
MYLLYIDESDTTRRENVAKRVYYGCGLRVVDSSYGQTTKRLAKVIATWKPALPDDFELKGYELFRGIGPWKGRQPDERGGVRAASAILCPGDQELSDVLRRILRRVRPLGVGGFG